ncbi:MAG: hypothetical protein A3K16_03330 [Omnitrophica bacterium RIFCSPLOWO2_01_FULL_45_24]|nr:MAG: hypothetical protein A3K16_03330 [Omnitrophica bacterium RIFCSPLOWO2_01_FULL_45_24]
MFNIVAVVFVMSCLIFSGCATFPSDKEPVQKSNLTSGVAKQTIIKGQTTQAEILKLFGAPNIVTKNRDSNEVWNYNRMSFESKQGADSIGGGLLAGLVSGGGSGGSGGALGGGAGVRAGGSRAMQTSTTKSFDLIIEFDKDGVVKDYSVISATF